MANEKVISLDLLTKYDEKIKNVISTGDAASIKKASYANNTLSFFTDTAEGAAAAFTISLPEEMYLDQTKTTVVDNFTWSATTYPNSTDPGLDGKPVLVMAVKGDSATSYSFASLAKLIDTYTGDNTSTVTTTVSSDNKITATVKVSAETGNVIKTKDDGLYVADTKIDFEKLPEYVWLETNSEVLIKDNGKIQKVSGLTVCNSALSLIEDTDTIGTESVYIDNDGDQVRYGIKINAFPATTDHIGAVQPDGTTITVDVNGKISANIPSTTYATEAEILALFN